MRHWAAHRSRCQQQKGQSSVITFKAKANINIHHHQPAAQVTKRDQSTTMAQGSYDKAHVMQVKTASANVQRLPTPHTALGAAARSSLTPVPAVRATLYIAGMHTGFTILLPKVNNYFTTQGRHRAHGKRKVTAHVWYLLFYVVDTTS